MKRLIFIFALICLAMPARASESLDLPIGKSGISIGLSTSLDDSYVMGGWDVNNREPMAGYGKEIFPIKHNGVEVMYISGTHMFAVGEEGRGAFGLGVGARPVTIINKIGAAAGMVNELIPLPKWADAVHQVASIEVGYSRRGLFGDSVSPGRQADCVTIGGQLQVPVSDFLRLFGSK